MNPNIRNSHDNLITPYYQARIEAMTREIKKLNGKIECLEAKLEIKEQNEKNT
tara:strand:+ start:179 stop:337 length:159 start_codon:yes stop_codon:yes gene_type:complete